MTKKQLEEKFIESLFEHHTPSGKISVSSILYPCLRKAYFTKKLGSYFDVITAYTFWLGKAVHKMNFLKNSEGEVEWEGIIGYMDEFEDETLVEKKTCRQIPRSPNQHHKTQIEYYYALALRNKKKVKKLFILYLQKEPSAWKFFEVMPRSVETIEKEMLEKKTILAKALKTDKMPDRTVTWLCKYCPYTPKCYEKKN
tara:strand:- start:204 stop:797 length:594 start_codon:yes stop_codon:yes gene_type:complete